MTAQVSRTLSYSLNFLFLPFQAPPFSFSRSPEYSVTRVTREFRLPYYVQPNFNRMYAEKSARLYDVGVFDVLAFSLSCTNTSLYLRCILKLENQIEMSYFLAECNREQQPLLQQLQRLQFYGTSTRPRFPTNSRSL